jgi:hypothetical protein
MDLDSNHDDGGDDYLPGLRCFRNRRIGDGGRGGSCVCKIGQGEELWPNCTMLGMTRDAP